VRLAVASEVAGRFRDGARLVEPLSDPDLPSQAVAFVLGVREPPGTPLLDALVDYLEPRDVLRIPDNCEHLIEACASCPYPSSWGDAERLGVRREAQKGNKTRSESATCLR
jgi:predicted ATPase